MFAVTCRTLHILTVNDRAYNELYRKIEKQDWAERWLNMYLYFFIILKILYKKPPRWEYSAQEVF